MKAKLRSPLPDVSFTKKRVTRPQKSFRSPLSSCVILVSFKIIVDWNTMTQVSSPGMTNANMQLVVLAVDLEKEMEYPEQKLEDGEFIVRKVVELTKLKEELEG